MGNICFGENEASKKARKVQTEMAKTTNPLVSRMDEEIKALTVQLNQINMVIDKKLSEVRGDATQLQRSELARLLKEKQKLRVKIFKKKRFQKTIERATEPYDDAGDVAATVHVLKQVSNIAKQLPLNTDEQKSALADAEQVVSDVVEHTTQVEDMLVSPSFPNGPVYDLEDLDEDEREFLSQVDDMVKERQLGELLSAAKTPDEAAASKKEEKEQLVHRSESPDELHDSSSQIHVALPLQ